MRDIAFKYFLIYVDYQSFERQLEILDVLKIIPEANSEHEDSDIEDYNKVSEILSNSLLPINFKSLDTDKDDERNKDQVDETKIHDPDVSTIPYEAMLHSNVNIHHLDKLHGSKYGMLNNDTSNTISFPK